MRKRKPEELKDSGIEWVEKIPSNWTLTSLRYVSSSIKNGTTEPQIDSGFTDYPVTRIETISSGNIDYGSVGYINAFKGINKYKLNRGDVIFSHINSLPMVGNCALYEGKHDLFHGMNLLRIQPGGNIIPSFLIQCLKSQFFSEKVKSVAKHAINQVSVSTSNLKSLPVFLPKLEEQKAIATFLDCKTQAIDQLIEKKQQLIEKLKEKRQALITKAVTKGLNPDAFMKDSGIEWLGEIPEHWEVVNLKWLSEIEYGIGGEIDTSNKDGVRLLSLPNVKKDGRLDLDKEYWISLSKEDKGKYLLQKGDLLFNWRNGSSDHLGKTVYFNEEGEFTHVSFLLRIRTNDYVLDSKYLHLLLGDYRDKGFFTSSKAGVNNTFNLTELKALQVILPPKSEQFAIIDELNKASSKAFKVVKNIEDQIQKLKEYRQSLISAAVTGKIDVRDEVTV